MSALLSVSGVSKAFGGLQALSDISLQVHAGEIFGLIGPNGAGKTTLFNALTGLYSIDRGEVRLLDSRLDGRKPHQVLHAGLARTFQNIRLFAEMTALENVLVGRHARTTSGVIGAVLRLPGTRREEADSRLDRLLRRRLQPEPVARPAPLASLGEMPVRRDLLPPAEIAVGSLDERDAEPRADEPHLLEPETVLLLGMDVRVVEVRGDVVALGEVREHVARARGAARMDENLTLGIHGLMGDGGS